MKKLFIILSIMFSLLVSPMNIFGDDVTTIEDEETPTALRKNNNQVYVYTISFMGALAMVYIYYSYRKNNTLTLQVSEVSKNDDGTLTVNLGYNNRTNKLIKVNYNDLRVKSGTAIILRNDTEEILEPGRHNDVLTAVIDADTNLNWSVNDLTINVDGKKVKIRH